MKNYINDLKDIISFKKCFNDFHFLYSILLFLPFLFIYTFVYIIIMLFGGNNG